MAFTGTANVESAGKSIARISGTGGTLTLGNGASGTIKMTGGDINLPATFPSHATDGLKWARVFCNDQKVTWAYSGSPIDTITLTNTDGANPTSDLVLFVEIPHSVIR